MRYDADFLAALWVIGAVTAMQAVLAFTLPLMALDLSGQGAGLALIKGAGFIPNILFAVFIGVVNDRIRKGAAFRGYCVALAGAALVLAAAVLVEAVSVAGLAVFMIVMNALTYAMGNAQMALIRLTVPERRLADATSLVSTVHATIATAAPAVAGLALVLLGHGGVILLAAILFVGAAVVSRRLSPEEVLPPPQPFWPALAEGARVLRANGDLVRMTAAIILTNAAAGAFEVALILRLARDLELDAFWVGVVLAAVGVGAIAASRIAAPLRRRMGARAAFFWPIWALAGLYLAFLADWSYGALIVLGAMVGAVTLFFDIAIWSYRQESTEARHMGRVAGLTGAIFKLAMPPVILLAGVLSDAGSLSAVFWLAAGLNAAAAIGLATIGGWGLPSLGPMKSDTPSG